MYISIDKALTILSIIGEEDSIGLDKDEAVQQALGVVCGAIEQKIKDGEINRNDILVTFE